MSRIETPVETLTRFTEISNWIDTSSLEALAGDLLVSHAESKLEWFTCFYQDRNGVLFEPERGPIIDADGGVSAQKNFNGELQDWFLTHDSGIAVGISPKGGRFQHPDNQIQIYRIAYELVDGKLDKVQKVLLCAFHQFSCELKNPEQLRRFIFPENDREDAIFEIIDWLVKTSEKKVETTAHNLNEKRQQAVYYASLLKSGEDPRKVFYQMSQSKFLGQNPIGCASANVTQGFSYFESLTSIPNYDGGGWHTGMCRVCHISTWVGSCDICKPCEARF
ncbi:MAG: hypothetical protein AAB535_00780 [Patescibacteria group bacterium]